jgi:hypothetical protein
VTAADDTTAGERECRCAPCPGRGNDGHGMTHCAECCYGTGVEAEYGCPVHNPTADADGTPPPAAGDVEGLARVILAERLTARELPNSYMDDGDLLAAMKPRAEAILASDWLRAHDAVRDAVVAERITQAKAEALREAAARWESLCTRGHPIDAEVADRIIPWLRDRADRIEARP